MTTFTSALQQELIAALQNHHLTTLDFSRYIPEPQELTFTGHTSRINGLTLLPNGQMLSCSSDKTLRIWDLNTGRCLKTLQGHTEDVWCIAVLPNGQVVSGSSDETLRVWDLSTGQCLKTLTGHTGYVSRTAILPNGQVVSGGQDNRLRVWDVATGKCLKILTEAGDPKNGAASVLQPMVLPNGPIVSIGHGDAHVWNINPDEPRQPYLRLPVGHYLTMLPNGQVLSTREYKYENRDYAIQVWDVSTGQCLKTLQGHTGHINCIAVLPNGQVVSGSFDKTLRVWDLSTGQCLKTLVGHKNHVSCVAALSNGQVVSGSPDDSTLRVWDLSTGQCLKTLPVTGAQNLLALPNGQFASSCSVQYDEILQIWDVSTGQCLKTLPKQRYLAMLPNGRMITYDTHHHVLKSWTITARHCYETIAPVLQAITPECGLQELSLRGVYLGQVGYESLRELVQNIPSLKTLDLQDTDLAPAEIDTLQQIVNKHRVREQQRQAQIQADQNRLLQAQAERIRHLETQLLTTLEGKPYLHTQVQTEQEQQLQEQAQRIRDLEIQLQVALQQTHVPCLTYPNVTFTSPIVEQAYHLIEDEAIPDEFLCPITRQIMWEPVMADDGYTYERDVIEAHFQRTLTSPMLPEEPLASQRLVLNRNVRAAIQRLLERHSGWTLYQPDAVYFASAYDVTVQTAIATHDTATLLRTIDQEPRLLTRSSTQGILIEQVWHQIELLEAVLQRLTPAIWSYLIQIEGSISNWLDKLAKLAAPSLASQVQGFTIFLQALQAGLSCEYPTEALIAQGLHQSLPALLLVGLNRLSGVNSPLDMEQNTALHYAAASGTLSLVATLVEQGATITLKNQRGQTPKALAQLGGHDAVVAYCQQTKLQPLMSQLLGNLGFLNIRQHQELREMIHQQQATILQLQAQLQTQDQELQYLRANCPSRSPEVKKSGDRAKLERRLKKVVF